MGILALTLASFLTSPLAMAQQSVPLDQAKDLANKAAAHVKDVGLDQSIKDFNNPTGGYQDGPLFVVVYSQDGKVLCAPGLPALVNRDATLMKDADGMEFGKAILAAPSGSWVDYRMTNPTIKKVDKKTSYVNHVGDLTVFVGAYLH